MADPASGSGDKSVQVKLVLLGEALHPDSQHSALRCDPLQPVISVNLAHPWSLPLEKHAGYINTMLMFNLCSRRGCCWQIISSPAFRENLQTSL
jgi:hypothetical protein